MAAENKPKTGTNANSKGKKRRQFLPYNKSVKKKGGYPLRPGVQGFFITCDGGRERQASQQAIYVVDSFYEELVHGKSSGMKPAGVPNKPLNKKIVFASSSSDDDDDNDDDGGEEEVEEKDKESGDDASHEKLTDKNSDPHDSDNVCCGKEMGGVTGENREDGENHESRANEAEEPPVKKQCLEAAASKCEINDKVEEKSIDRLIESELQELGDKNKRRFVILDSGCNGVAFVQMRKRDGDPGPKDIVQHMMTSVASTRKPVSRSILRVLPIELSCYASEEEISKAIKPLVEQNFPVQTQNPQKFAVLYEARANTGIDRMKIINSVAKSVPAPHKVDLSNPDKTIVVEIVKTVCMIGVVEKYKELAKFNLRQLTSPK